MQKSDSIVELSKALAKFREEVKQPMKDADNPFFKSRYVPLENVVEAIDEVAPKHGLTFTQWALSNEQGNVGTATLLLHSSGEYIEYDPIFMKPEKNTPQAIGSAITYSRRYSLSAIFGITSDEDDDGNQASGNVRQNKPKQQTQDKGKVQLVQQNAQDLSDIINANVDKDKQTTKEQILNAYLEKVGANGMANATNEQLINISQLIKKNIAKYENQN